MATKHTAFTEKECDEIRKILIWFFGTQRIPHADLSPNERDLMNVNCECQDHHVHLDHRCIYRIAKKLGLEGS